MAVIRQFPRVNKTHPRVSPSLGTQELLVVVSRAYPLRFAYRLLLLTHKLRTSNQQGTYRGQDAVGRDKDWHTVDSKRQPPCE